jgi:drug/metabolite transporter (DMT)-like permease
MKHSSTRRGYLMIAGAAFFWGMSATLAKMLMVQKVGTILLVQTRVTFALAGMALGFAVIRPNLFRISPRHLLPVSLMGIIGVAGSNFTYYFAIREGTIATAILLQYTAPLLVTAYMTATREEALSVAKIVAAVIAVAGCAVAVGGLNPAAHHTSTAGVVSGIAAAVCFAFMSVSSRRLLTSVNVWTATLYALFFASVFWAIVNPPWAIGEQLPETALWMKLAGFAMVSVLIPHTLFFAGLQYVVPSRALIVSTSEPVVAIVSAAVLLGESLMGEQIAGAVLVLVAITIIQIRKEPGGEEIRGGRDVAY